MRILASKKNKAESKRSKSEEGKQQAVICANVVVVGGVSLT